MIQEARPWLVNFPAAAAFNRFPVFWVILVGLFSGSFCVLGSEFPSLGCSWRFLRLEIFIFLLGLFQVFRNFKIRVWGVYCVVGLGSLVPSIFFLVLPTPPAQC